MQITSIADVLRRESNIKNEIRLYIWCKIKSYCFFLVLQCEVPALLPMTWPTQNPQDIINIMYVILVIICMDKTQTMCLKYTIMYKQQKKKKNTPDIFHILKWTKTMFLHKHWWDSFHLGTACFFTTTRGLLMWNSHDRTNPWSE